MSDVIRHIVLVRFKDDAKAEDRQKFIDIVNKGISAIPYVNSFGTGSAFQPRTYTKGNTERWDWGQCFEMPSDKVVYYMDDEPFHKSVSGSIPREVVDQFAILDFVVDFRGPR